MKSKQRFRDILSRVELPGWRFRVAYFAGGQQCYLQTVREEDGCHPRYGDYKWPLDDDDETSVVLDTALKAVMEELEIEAKENFLYRGKAVYLGTLEKAVAEADSGREPSDGGEPDEGVRPLNGSLLSAHRGHGYECLQFAARDVSHFWVARHRPSGMYLDASMRFLAPTVREAYWYYDVEAARHAAVQAIEAVVAPVAGESPGAGVGHGPHREPGSGSAPVANGVSPSSVRPVWAPGCGVFLGVHRGVGLRFTRREDGTWTCVFPLSGQVLWRLTVARDTSMPFGFPTIPEAVSTARKAVDEDWGRVRTVAGRSGSDKSDVEVLAELAGVGPEGWAESARPGWTALDRGRAVR